MGWVVEAEVARARHVSLPRALMVPVAGVLLLILSGTLGLMLIEGWSLLDAVWMVVITVSTIGFGEVHPLSSQGRVFLLVFIVLGLGLASTMLSTLARVTAEGTWMHDLLARRRLRELRDMKNHHIVVGYGRLGREIVADLTHHGAQVLVLDSAAQTCLPKGVNQLVGDATDDAVLLEAGVQRARGLAIATPSDAVNVYVTLSARQLAADLHIITRLEDEAGKAKAVRAGADDVLLPFHLSGARMAQALLRPGSSAFVDHATLRHFDDLHMEDVRLIEGSPIRGTLAELDLRGAYGVIIVAIRRSGELELHTPDPHQQLHPGDVLVAVGPPDMVGAFRAAACTVDPHEG